MIRYILPNGEMVIIDEAAAIPLHIVKRIMSECLTFIDNTIQGKVVEY